MADEELQDQMDSDNQDLGEDMAEESLEAKLKEVIDIQVDDIGPLRKKLTVTVPEDAIAEQLDDQYSEMQREAQVPGFRKGRAPRRLLEKRFGNEISETLIQQLVSNSYMAATDKADLKVLGEPLVWAKEEGSEVETLMDPQDAMRRIELPDSGPLTYACEIEIQPEFELPKIEGVPVSKPVIKVEDDDVNEQIERILAMRGEYETIPDGSVEEDDVVLADIKMTSDGTTLKEQEMVRMAARPQTVDGVTIENLGEVLAGAKAGDTRTVSGTIPDDYTKAEYRGKQADFEINIREVQRLFVPDLDEEFLSSVGFENEQELRDFVRQDLESRVDEQARQGMIGQVYDYLLDNTELELPERLSERQTSRVLTRRLLDLYQQGMPPAEAEKHLDEMKTKAREEAARELKRSFIMERLSEEFDVTVKDAEINGAIASIAQRQGRRFDRVREELHKQGAIADIYAQLRDEKIISQLLEKAEVSESEMDKSERKPAKKAARKKTSKKSSSKKKTAKKTASKKTAKKKSSKKKS
jgi:trigger factor